MFFAKFDEENKVWSNDDVPCVLNPKISIAHALLRSMLLNGSKIAQVNLFEINLLKLMRLKNGYECKAIIFSYELFPTDKR